MSRTTEPKPLHRDPEAIVALVATVLLAVAPHDTFERVTSNPGVFGPLAAVVLGGRYALRYADSKSVGKR